MFDRHLTWIDGPAGAGKTTLVEQIVRSNRAKEIAALRIRTDPTIASPLYAAAAERSPEVGRWVAAGAGFAGTLRVPEGWSGDLLHALEECDNVELLYIADVWLVEGSIEYAAGLHDTLVFVTPPLEDGQGAVVEEEREVARIDGMTALRIIAGRYAEEAGDPAGDEPWPSTPPEELPEGLRPGDIDEETGEEIVDVFEIPDELGWQIVKILEEGVPSKQHKHWLLHGLEGAADAHVVVVNAVDAAQPGAARPGDDGAARRLVEELQTLWRDDTLRNEVLGSRLGRRTILAARLADRRDEGTRKAVAAIKRRWRDTFRPVRRSSLWDDDDTWS